MQFWRRCLYWINIRIHFSYTRRAKLGDSRSTGRLHSTSHTHRSMTRLNVAGGSVGGLHKSMTRLSSSQQINNNIINGTVGSNTSGHSSGNVAQMQIGVSTLGGGGNYVTPVPPLSSNVIITGHNKWGIPATKITSGGVTVTTSPPRQLLRPHSQGPSTLLLSGSNSGLGSLTSCNNSYNLMNGNVQARTGTVAVHHIAPASPTESTMTLSVNGVSVLVVCTLRLHKFTLKFSALGQQHGQVDQREHRRRGSISHRYLAPQRQYECDVNKCLSHDESDDQPADECI